MYLPVFHQCILYVLSNKSFKVHQIYLSRAIKCIFYVSSNSSFMFHQMCPYIPSNASLCFIKFILHVIHSIYVHLHFEKCWVQCPSCRFRSLYRKFAGEEGPNAERHTSLNVKGVWRSELSSEKMLLSHMFT